MVAGGIYPWFKGALEAKGLYDIADPAHHRVFLRRGPEGQSAFPTANV